MSYIFDKIFIVTNSYLHLLIFCFVSLLVQYVYCGSDKSLWHCKRVFNKHVECVYAICSEFKNSLDDTSSKRKKEGHQIP